MRAFRQAFIEPGIPSDRPHGGDQFGAPPCRSTACRRPGWRVVTRYVIVLIIMHVALTILAGAAIFVLLMLEDFMRTILAIAFLGFASLPAAADDLTDLRSRVDELEMRLDDLEQQRTPPPRIWIDPSYLSHVRPSYPPLPPLPLAIESAIPHNPGAAPVCRSAGFCGDGPLLRAGGPP